MNAAPASAGGAGAITLTALTKHYGSVAAVQDVDLEIRPGEFVTLLGESGSGKSTTLLMVAGFEQPSSGDILLDGRSVSGVPPHRRNLGMVFQNYALFPHMTVEQNIGFPLKRRGLDRGDIRKHVREALELVNLTGYEARYPRELSGGQQQRIAVARATVYRPPALLMDEPLSALDKKLRQALQEEIRNLHRNLNTTIVYVTHDQEEALALSDRIGLMCDGRIVQVGTPRDVYNRPETLFAAGFLGEANLLVGEVAGRERAGVVAVRLRDGSVVHASAGDEVAPGQPVTVVVRPERLRVSAGASNNGAVTARVEELVFVGSNIRCLGRFATGERWIAQLDPADDSSGPQLGGECAVSWSPEDATVVPETAAGA
jgi:putative spermidine/putrescine transport system ATP-binding protein